MQIREAKDLEGPRLVYGIPMYQLNFDNRRQTSKRCSVFELPVGSVLSCCVKSGAAGLSEGIEGNTYLGSGLYVNEQVRPSEGSRGSASLLTVK